MFSKSISVLILTICMLFMFSCKENNQSNSSEETDIIKETSSVSDGMEQVKYTVSLGLMPSTKYQGDGLFIGKINDGGVAFKAGLLKKDIILEMDGEKITDLLYYTKILSNYTIGDTAKVKVKRGEEIMDYQIVFD